MIPAFELNPVQRHSLVTVSAEIVDAEPVPYYRTGKFVRPVRIKVDYRNKHEGSGWKSSASITALNIRQDGSDGAPKHLWVWADESPKGLEWVPDFVRDHTPDEAGAQ